MNAGKRIVLLACGKPDPGLAARSPAPAGSPVPVGSVPVGSVPVGPVPVVSLEVPARPDRAVLDGILAAHEPDRLVVLGTDADLAAVVLRLLRRERLDVEVGYAPTGRSYAAAAWGLPPRRSALALALHGQVAAVPLVRDDAGGVLVGRGELPGVRGESYCDNELMLRGWTRRLVVTPGPLGVRVTVAGGRLRRPLRAEGRAVQIGCEPAMVLCDGVPHPRPIERWTWYRHTADLKVLR